MHCIIQQTTLSARTNNPEHAALLRDHYAGNHPGLLWRRYTAVCDDAPLVTAGVLLLAMPVLNAPWRAIAWPTLFSGIAKREAARRANAHVRTISRIAVDPRFRGRGIGSALVRRAVADFHAASSSDAQPHLLEAVASMALVIPVFSAAGMRSISLPISARNQLLTLALTRAGLCHADLIDPETSFVISSATGGPLAKLASALRAWARSSGGTRKLVNGPALAMHHAAARGLAEKAVFVAGDALVAHAARLAPAAQEPRS